MSIFLINYFIDLFYINQYTICRLLRYKEGFSLANGKTIEKSTTIRVRLSSYNNIKKLADSEHITIQDFRRLQKEDIFYRVKRIYP
jgi:hypothetical protein